MASISPPQSSKSGDTSTLNMQNSSDAGLLTAGERESSMAELSDKTDTEYIGPRAPVGMSGEGGGGDNENGEGENSENELMDMEVPLESSSSHDDDTNNNTSTNGPLVNRADAAAPSLSNGWDDEAIMSCFKHTVMSHFTSSTTLAREEHWEPGPNVFPATSRCHAATESDNKMQNKQKYGIETTCIDDAFEKQEGGIVDNNAVADEKKSEVGWKPKPLPLPSWAVDPTFAMAHLKSTTANP